MTARWRGGRLRTAVTRTSPKLGVSGDRTSAVGHDGGRHLAVPPPTAPVDRLVDHDAADIRIGALPGRDACPVRPRAHQGRLHQVLCRLPVAGQQPRGAQQRALTVDHESPGSPLWCPTGPPLIPLLNQTGWTPPQVAVKRPDGSADRPTAQPAGAAVIAGEGGRRPRCATRQLSGSATRRPRPNSSASSSVTMANEPGGTRSSSATRDAARSTAASSVPVRKKM